MLLILSMIAPCKDCLHEIKEEDDDADEQDDDDDNDVNDDDDDDDVPVQGLL